MEGDEVKEKAHQQVHRHTIALGNTMASPTVTVAASVDECEHKFIEALQILGIHRTVDLCKNVHKMAMKITTCATTFTDAIQYLVGGDDKSRNMQACFTSHHSLQSINTSSTRLMRASIELQKTSKETDEPTHLFLHFGKRVVDFTPLERSYSSAISSIHWNVISQSANDDVYALRGQLLLHKFVTWKRIAQFLRQLILIVATYSPESMSEMFLKIFPSTADFFSNLVEMPKLSLQMEPIAEDPRAQIMTVRIPLNVLNVKAMFPGISVFFHRWERIGFKILDGTSSKQLCEIVVSGTQQFGKLFSFWLCVLT
jgi:hypothetical protein